MAVHYLASPVDGRVGSLAGEKPRSLVVRSKSHNLDLVADAIRNAWLPELTSSAQVRWATPANSSALIASVYVYTPEAVTLAATLVIEEMEQ